MPSRHLVRAFFALWWILGLLLLAYSVGTAWHALRFGTGGGSLHVAALASVEAVAALLFLVPSTMRVAGVCLLATFAVAFVVHAGRGEVASQLLLYAASVIFIMVHGRVPARMLLGHAKQGVRVQGFDSG
jgi:hypothetical protein